MASCICIQSMLSSQIQAFYPNEFKRLPETLSVQRVGQLIQHVILREDIYNKHIFFNTVTRVA